MQSDLVGARAVVTDGTRGIGAAAVRSLAAAGAEVVAVARTAVPVPDGVRFVGADLATADGVAAAARQVLDALGGLDVLVNNAGRNTQVPDGVLAATDADWQANLEVNLLSVVRLDRALVPTMTAQGHGVVIHVSSNAAHFPQPNGVPYAAAKAALNAYGKGLANAVGPAGVRVVGVLPGVIETEAFTETVARTADRTDRHPDEVRREVLDRLAAPLGRPGRADEVGELIAFLASPRASYLTGIEVRVDGGVHRTL